MVQTKTYPKTRAPNTRFWRENVCATEKENQYIRNPKENTLKMEREGGIKNQDQTRR